MNSMAKVKNLKAVQLMGPPLEVLSIKLLLVQLCGDVLVPSGAQH